MSDQAMWAMIKLREMAVWANIFDDCSSAFRQNYPRDWLQYEWGQQCTLANVVKLIREAGF